MSHSDRSSRLQRERMSRELNRKKQVKAVGDENTRARRAYIWLSGIMTFLTGLSMFFTIFQIIEGGPWDPLATVIYAIIFVCFAVGMYGIFNLQPPLHLLVPLGATINLLFSIVIIFTGNSRGLFLGAMSFVILYLAARYPINMSETRSTFIKR